MIVAFKTFDGLTSLEDFPCDGRSVPRFIRRSMNTHLDPRVDRIGYSQLEHMYSAPQCREYRFRGKVYAGAPLFEEFTP